MNGVQIVEWGCHDRHAGTRSFPPALVDEINDKYGPHPIGTVPHGLREHYAPCDFVHRAGEHRTAEENRALLETVRHAIAVKRAASVDLLTGDDWDLYFAVFGEAHCSGHQFWHVHDETHPWHDAAARARLGGDPLRDGLRGARRHDRRAHLERLDDETTVYVLLSHGMRAHYDGTQLLDPVLWRLDEYASGALERGVMSRAADAASARLPRALCAPPRSARPAGLRRRLQDRVPLGYFEGEMPWLGQRRWWAQLNDTVSGCVRVNLEGREPNGRVAAGQFRAVMYWLAERLRELVNVDTGEPAVADVLLTDDNYERVPGDAFGDLIIEWNRTAPIETVWSPATGIVRVPYEEWRTGDHHRGGLLLARGRASNPAGAANACPCSTSRRPSPRRSGSTSPISTERRASISFPAPAHEPRRARGLGVRCAVARRPAGARPRTGGAGAARVRRARRDVDGPVRDRARDRAPSHERGARRDAGVGRRAARSSAGARDGRVGRDGHGVAAPDRRSGEARRSAWCCRPATGASCCRVRSSPCTRRRIRVGN